ncbi:MAG: transposase [Actinomycetota bacterium]
MAYDYIPVRRNQVMLLPVDMNDWLEDTHLAKFVAAMVDRFDTTVLHDAHPNVGPGRPAYDPEMMLALLVYAYAIGTRSSRRIEASCRTDAAFRYLTGGLVPDHATIARFIVDQQDAMEPLFVSGLRVMDHAGMVDLSLLAIDGTKMAANASLRANHTKEWIRTQVKALLEATLASEATEEAGAAVDAMSAAAISGVLGRLARLDAAMDAIEAEDAAQAAERAARTEPARAKAETGKKLGGRKPKDPAAALARAEAEYEAVRTRLEAKAAKRAALEAAAAAESRAVKGPAPKPDASLEKAEAALAAAEAALDAAPVVRTRANTTDADSRVMKTQKGYLQGYNAQSAVTLNGIVVGSFVTNAAVDVHQLEPMLAQIAANPALAGCLPPDGFTVDADAGYWSEANAGLAGQTELASPQLLIATQKDWKQRKAAQQAGTTVGEPPEGASALEAMEHRLRTAEGAATYRRRSSTVEPVFGDCKHNSGYRSFRRRGLPAVGAEWALINLTHNLTKLYHHVLRPDPAEG